MLLDNQEIKRVLAIKLGSQQDVMLTIPALQKLRDLFKNAVITLMSQEKQDENIPWVDNILVYKNAKFNFKNPEYELALIAKLREYAFDAAVIFTNPRESPYALAYICYLAGIPIRIGQSQEFGGGVLSQNNVETRNLPAVHSVNASLQQSTILFNN